MRQQWQTFFATALTAGALSCASGAPPAAAAAAPPTATTLAPVDYTFIGLTFLGNRYQVDTGRLAATRSPDPTVRRYGHLMDTSHVTVETRLVALLHQLGVEPPPASLLSGAYASLVRGLTAQQGRAFDRDYVADQVDYQKSNDALYRWELTNGSSPELKRFATEVLPKVDDHLQQALALSAASSL